MGVRFALLTSSSHPFPPALRSPLEDTMAPLNVADLESRVRVAAWR